MKEKKPWMGLTPLKIKLDRLKWNILLTGGYRKFMEQDMIIVERNGKEYEIAVVPWEPLDWKYWVLHIHPSVGSIPYYKTGDIRRDFAVVAEAAELIAKAFELLGFRVKHKGVHIETKRPV